MFLKIDKEGEEREVEKNVKRNFMKPNIKLKLFLLSDELISNILETFI